jgi:hypothetical protein
MLSAGVSGHGGVYAWSSKGFLTCRHDGLRGLRLVQGDGVQGDGWARSGCDGMGWVSCLRGKYVTLCEGLSVVSRSSIHHVG